MRLSFALPPFALPLAAALVLAGCNSGTVTAENESAEAVGKKVAATGIKPLPGRWEATINIEKLDIPGMPADAKAGMPKAAKTISTCLTPEQVNQPNGGFFGGGGQDCTYKHFVMAGGKVDAAMTCGQAPYQREMTLNGTYTESSYDIKVSSKSEVQPGKTMEMSMSGSGKRTGECDGKEDITEKDVKAMREYAEKAKK